MGKTLHMAFILIQPPPQPNEVHIITPILQTSELRLYIHG